MTCRLLLPLPLPQAVVEEDCMPMDQFSQHLLPSLLSLSSDPVANVRVLVAKALRQSVMEKGAHAASERTGVKVARHG